MRYTTHYRDDVVKSPASLAAYAKAVADALVVQHDEVWRTPRHPAAVVLVGRGRSGLPRMAAVATELAGRGTVPGMPVGMAPVGTGHGHALATDCWPFADRLPEGHPVWAVFCDDFVSSGDTLTACIDAVKADAPEGTVLRWFAALSEPCVAEQLGVQTLHLRARRPRRPQPTGPIAPAMMPLSPKEPDVSTPRAMQTKIAASLGISPSEVWRRQGPGGFGWYARPFGQPERFLGRSGAEVTRLRRERDRTAG